MVIDDIKSQMIHIPKKIMNEVYEMDANPRYATLLLFLEYNYPEYNNETDASFIWENAHKNQEQLLIAIQ